MDIDQASQGLEMTWKTEGRVKKGLFWLLPSTGVYWGLLGGPGMCWDAMGYTGMHWNALVFTGLPWYLLVFTRMH